LNGREASREELGRVHPSSSIFVKQNKKLNGSRQIIETLSYKDAVDIGIITVISNSQGSPCLFSGIIGIDPFFM
jgi:hypothetical protein